MGILNDTSSRQKMSIFISNHSFKLMFMSFIVGVVWFCLLACDAFNNKTYFSENALLPGLVERKFNPGSSIKRTLDSLNGEVKNHKSVMPSAWIQGNFRQIGLDLYNNNFTMSYPLGSKTTYTGNNIYAILRAPKVASTEAIVISTPYRNFESLNDNTLPSIALMVELARLFRQKEYWSKDIIFLITEHENIGFQAWLDAYHGVVTSESLRSEKLRGISGPIQGVINLEISSEQFSHIDVRIEGLHGQLPNLDLFNLAIELCGREQVLTTFHSRFDIYPSRAITWDGWLHNFKTMGNMILMQATGLPFGGHGLFHRFGIQAITLKSETKTAEFTALNLAVTLSQMGRVLEGMTRSINNLLEKFHQSFFFYLLPSTKRYVSIGMYMPPFALIALPILIKALDLYISLQTANSKEILSSQTIDPNYWPCLETVLTNFMFGMVVFFSPSYLGYFKMYFDYSNEDSLYVMHILLLSLWLFYWFCKNFNVHVQQTESNFKSCLVLLILGATLYTLSLVNISLSLILVLGFTPIAVFIQSRRLMLFQYLYLILVNPFVFTYLIIVIQSYYIDQNAAWYAHLVRAINGHKKTLLYAIEDSYLFNNWNYKMITTVVLPLWYNLWTLKIFSS